ncbi:hypothetical protein LU604_25370 [Erwinia tracheiphila]|uniref:hypothetical protein n=1 Tax=Erwinia tracheiphila TaxID=65700 RepID=UPI001F267A61|nr:hypothetical protein [Erwinia tracheiphila]UIA83531.1 hypothetical protein LU604_25370 [Erwinia tracheiphila]UIA92117.1 hypothetical protein LU632_24845 [Erwinia tracheiphila]
MTVREKPKQHGFAVLMKGFPGTDPYQCILCKGRRRFAGTVGRVSTPQKCSLAVCIRWRKNDGCGCLSWIGAPEKQVSG